MIRTTALLRGREARCGPTDCCPVARRDIAGCQFGQDAIRVASSTLIFRREARNAPTDGVGRSGRINRIIAARRKSRARKVATKMLIGRNPDPTAQRGSGYRACTDPTRFASPPWRLETVRMHAFGLLVGGCRSTPAALMRSVHHCPEQVNGSNEAAGAERRFQDTDSTDFVIMCQSYANLRWLKSGIKRVSPSYG